MVRASFTLVAGRSWCLLSAVAFTVAGCADEAGTASRPSASASTSLVATSSVASTDEATTVATTAAALVSVDRKLRAGACGRHDCRCPGDRGADLRAGACGGSGSVD